MLGPFNNPGVDDSGYYVPFFASPAGPAVTTTVASQFATIAAKPRPGQDVTSLPNILRRTVMKIDPNLPLYFVSTPQSQLDGFVASNRIIAMMFTIFGVVAVVLAAVGIYGVMSFSVSQRTQEFGVRMALGADARRILAMVLRQGGVQITIGVVLGLGLAFTLAALIGAGMQNVLFNVDRPRSGDLRRGRRAGDRGVADGHRSARASSDASGADDGSAIVEAGPGVVSCRRIENRKLGRPRSYTGGLKPAGVLHFADAALTSPNGD